MTSAVISAQVEHIFPLTDRILKIILAPSNYIDYQAGQYLQILSADDSLSYSIANAPLGAHKYELHIRHVQQNPYNQKLFAEIRQRGAVNISLPFGDCHLNRLKSGAPILFIAGGTGFAPIKAMIEQLLATGDPRPFELYWSARSQSDLYMDDKVKQWQAHVNHFRYFPLLSDANLKDKIADYVFNQHTHDLNHYEIVIGGPFDMVYETRDALVSKGISANNMYSDAFSFEEKKE
ncbi:NAD(P)H-flavin reductase [Legionella beliardensis]|uniref:NAD(P)H-flavin reductase n=1 Tax=Legionella beliardensis TaxID=91822 RepID=A0A378HYK1_9GAMM|nr:NAD(P)H-flavin reductase [Legionella beliardensis]STX27550.1 NAD(P)H-flavin reductase [Legionella beliardensis]